MQIPGFSKFFVPFVPMICVLVLWPVQPWGWQGSLLFCLLVLLLFGFGLWRVHTQLKRNFSQWLKDWLSRQRHDWMNHLQVMMGYVSLKKTDQLKQYLSRLSQRLNHERNLAELRHAPFLLFLLTLPAQYPKWEWELEVPEKLQFTNEKREKEAYRLLCRFFDLLAKVSPQEVGKIVLEIAGNEQNVTFCIELLDGDDHPQSIDIPQEEWQKMEKICSRMHAEMIRLEDASGFYIATLR